MHDACCVMRGGYCVRVRDAKLGTKNVIGLRDGDGPCRPGRVGDARTPREPNALGLRDAFRAFGPTGAARPVSNGPARATRPRLLSIEPGHASPITFPAPGGTSFRRNSQAIAPR